MSKIIFTPPTKQTPGFLRRQKTALALAKRLKGDPDPALVDEMIAFLLPFVTEPVDRAAAVEALMDATEEQFDGLLKTVSGDTPNPLPGSESS